MFKTSSFLNVVLTFLFGSKNVIQNILENVSLLLY